MKKVKYRITKEDDIGDGIPLESIVEVILVEKGDSGDGIIYFPKEARYSYKGNIFIQKGCGSMSFAILDGKYWIRSRFNFINLKNKDSKKYEPTS